MLDDYDPIRINAVVLLTDGVNDDGDSSDDQEQKRRLHPDHHRRVDR